jgi:hypothetical protein
MPRAFQISRHAAATLAVMVLALPSLFPQPCHCPCCETRAPDAKVTASASDKTSCGQTKCPHCDREAPGKAGQSQSQGCCKNCTAGCSLDKPTYQLSTDSMSELWSLAPVGLVAPQTLDEPASPYLPGLLRPPRI